MIICYIDLTSISEVVMHVKFLHIQFMHYATIILNYITYCDD